LQYFGHTVSTEEANTTQGGDSGQTSSSGGESSSNSLKAKNGIENIGLAVFKDERMVGKLSPTETLCHLLVTNELQSCNLSIPDPDNSNSRIDLYVTLNNPTKTNVYILNGTPYVKIDVNVNSRISSISNLSEGNAQERITRIEKAAENYLRTQIFDYLYKTSKYLETDIIGAGKYALKHFNTAYDFENYNWLEKYTDAFFEVSTSLNVKSSFLLTGT